MNGKAQEEVDQFKYLGSTQTKDGTSLKEVKIRLGQTHSAMTRLVVLWDKVITTMKLRRSTPAHIVFNLRSLTWGFGESCTIVHVITSQPASVSSNVLSGQFRRPSTVWLQSEMPEKQLTEKWRV